MSVNYTNLFGDIGKLAKYYNQFATDASGLSAYIDAIETQFASDQQAGAINGLRPTQEQSWLTNYVNRRSALAGYALARFQDLDTVLSQIGAVSSDQTAIFTLFIAQMVADSQTVNRSIASLGSPTAGGNNAGSGTIVPTLVLDGITSPGYRTGVTFPAHYLYRGLASELVIAETHTLTCIADSFFDNTTEGGESFQWTAGYPDVQNGVGTEGSGSVSTITAIHGNTSRYLQNADFESFSVANTPDSWTVVTGTVGTNIFEGTASGKFYHGASSLKLSGDGTTAAIELIQSFNSSTIKAGRAYCVTCRLLADSSISAGDLLIEFKGTGYTAGTTEKISVAHGSLPTSWTLESFFVNMPAEIPSDFALSIKWSGTPSSGKNVYIDDMGMDVVNYGAGFGMVVVRGSTPFARNDKFTLANTTTEGIVQKFFRQVFGYMLPSDASSPTIADSVAT